MTVYSDTLGILQELRARFEPLEPDAPWGGNLGDWYEHFERKLDLDITEEEMAEGSRAVMHWVKKKFGAAKMAAHRAFVKMVRKDPAAHRRKMRQSAKYHRLHKWHDALMSKTSRPGWIRRHIRAHEEIPDDMMGLEERDPGQAFMDLPFELRVTGRGRGPGTGDGPGGRCVCPECGYSSSHKIGSPCLGKPCPKCGAKMTRAVGEAATDSGAELTDKGRVKASQAASDKTGKAVPQHYQKTCSMASFNANVEYFYRVKGKEWEGSKQEKLQRAIAASYSVLKRSCGVHPKENKTPSQIVKAGGGQPGPRGAR